MMPDTSREEKWKEGGKRDTSLLLWTREEGNARREGGRVEVNAAKNGAPISLISQGPVRQKVKKK